MESLKFLTKLCAVMETNYTSRIWFVPSALTIIGQLFHELNIDVISIQLGEIIVPSEITNITELLREIDK